MTLSPQQAEAIPPPVADALRRLCHLVEQEGGSWRVGTVPAGKDTGALAEGLYNHWYTQPPARPAAGAANDPPLWRRSLLPALRAAHFDAARTVAGWMVMSADAGGAVSAAQGESAQALQAGEYVMPLRPGVPAAPGEPVEPLARLDHVDIERGIWWAFSDPGPSGPKGRLYLNLRPETAPHVVHEVTAALVSLPYQLKCPILAAACARVDALVVYHQRPDRQEAVAALLQRWAVLGPLLDPAVPPLTFPVRPGLAWADEVEQERSYGETRCHALAAAIEGGAATWRAGDAEARLALLTSGLREAGIDPARPWETAA